MNQQINSLTVTRGFAALFVFIFHYGTYIYPFDKLPWLFTNGNLAVSYFFALSGFILFVTYSNKNVTYKSFIGKRIARIYPIYFLALVLQLIVIRRDIITDTHAPTEILSSLLLVQAYFPSYALSLNSPGWSICSEMLFYLGFPFLFSLAKRNRNLFLTIAIAIYFLTQLFCIELCCSDKVIFGSWTSFRYNPIIHMNQFLIGMSGGLLLDLNSKKKYNIVFPIMICVCILCLIYFMPSWLDSTAGLIAPLFILLIVAISSVRFILPNMKPLTYLGEISYSIYILQSPVRELMHQFNAEFNLLSDNSFFYFSLAILIIAATLSYRFVEKPFRQWIVTKNEEWYIRGQINQ